jgi:hypothetical protein
MLRKSPCPRPIRTIAQSLSGANLYPIAIRINHHALIVAISGAPRPIHHATPSSRKRCVSISTICSEPTEIARWVNPRHCVPGANATSESVVDVIASIRAPLSNSRKHDSKPFLEFT